MFSTSTKAQLDSKTARKQKQCNTSEESEMQPPFNLLLDPCDEADNLPQCPILRYMQLGPYDALVRYYIPCDPILPIDADLHMVDWVY